MDERSGRGRSLEHQAGCRDHREPSGCGRVLPQRSQCGPLGPLADRAVEFESEHARGMGCGQRQVFVEPVLPLDIERAARIAIHDHLTRSRFRERGSDHIGLPGPETVTAGMRPNGRRMPLPVVVAEGPLIERTDRGEAVEGLGLISNPAE